MGALHEGHLSLVRTAQAECDFTVVTIFVNPTQFGPNEDFARYPRTLEADLKILAGCRTDLVFAPQPAEVYPSGFDSRVEVGAVALPLEGQFRPGHFSGVATVVLKLFNMVGADVAFFGQKDFQQTRVIRRMAVDLNVPTVVRVCPHGSGVGRAGHEFAQSLSLSRCSAASPITLAQPVPGRRVDLQRPALCSHDRRPDARSTPGGRRLDRLR